MRRLIQFSKDEGIHKELQYKVEMLEYKKLKVMQLRINKFRLPVGE